MRKKQRNKQTKNNAVKLDEHHTPAELGDQRWGRGQKGDSERGPLPAASYTGEGHSASAADYLTQTAPPGWAGS